MHCQQGSAGMGRTLHLFNYLHAGRFCTHFCRALFYKLTLSERGFSGIPPECLTYSIQIRSEVRSVLIWVQTVCKGYQQETQSPIAGKRDEELHQGLGAYRALTIVLEIKSIVHRNLCNSKICLPAYKFK